MMTSQVISSRSSVVAETSFLLGRGGIHPDGLLNLIIRGVVVIEFSPHL